MLSERQMEILNLARAQRRVSVDELAEKFSVTSQTIRRELNDLCQRQMLQRVHGGAVMLSGIENVSYDSRRVLAPDAKRRIGVKAASLIPGNCALFINIGTTTEQVAHALTNHVGLVAITNNINVANILRPAHGIEVIIAGGVVRRSDGGIVGEATVDFINQFKVDYAVIGASAIDPDGTILDYDYREVWVSQAIMRNARQVILVADAMKFRRSAPMRIAHFSQINVFVTDEELPQPLARIAAESGVQVEIAAD
ncbi:MAG TPA: DeoR/GlpR family DNA-binding transcription regulator [Hypericibacter adhaerens]|uniref:DeoR/GlpR family DNA-binding transcription regulator n=1 Tax=Hypericibacter adhaerens TaxID=2602016 RepID=UPI002BE00613|nr:DeoR/GlpR family DNA-binding transcription regulator [Hypericibacter adhaerens]HWA42824.1 DeoR/GlpR family DNA-binding transcription regulator [Hypericibacter adhaerens]